MAKRKKPKARSVGAKANTVPLETAEKTSDARTDEPPASTAGAPSKKQSSSTASAQQTVDSAVISLVDELLPPEPGMEHLSTARVLLMGASLLTVGTIGFYYIPGMINKDVDLPGNHLINAFYCAAITLTTVGFGDICPAEATTEGKIFLLIFAFAGLGIFCGPIVQLGAAWRHVIPGGLPALGSFVLGLGVTIFTVLEERTHFEAIYASVITGTTIGFGDITPKTDAGKVAVALYAIVSVHAVAILLDPARQYLERLCRRPIPIKSKIKTKKPTKQD